jgi:hypothetical protein
MSLKTSLPKNLRAWFLPRNRPHDVCHRHRAQLHRSAQWHRVQPLRYLVRKHRQCRRLQRRLRQHRVLRRARRHQHRVLRRARRHQHRVLRRARRHQHRVLRRACRRLGHLCQRARLLEAHHQSEL